MKCKYPQIYNKRNPVPLPCGQCLPCRISQRRVKAHRMVCESMDHDFNSFLTCTYDDDHLPQEFVHPDTGEIFAAGTLSPLDHELFLKRLRVNAQRKLDLQFRFFGVGEYGEKSQRPHYHYCLFGFPPCPARGARMVGRRFISCKCSICSLVSESWGAGNIFLGDFTLDSAQYVAGYVTKKLTSDKSKFQSDILQGRYPEFARSSRRPGIGANFVHRISSLLQPYGPFDINNVPRVLSHGNKLLPLGRYMQDKLYESLGVNFSDGERLSNYEKSLQSLFGSGSSLSSDVQKRLASPSPYGMALAMEMLNAQSAINLEARVKLFSKEKSL